MNATFKKVCNVAASDLIPEVNKMPGMRIALAVALGVVMVILLRLAFAS